MIYVRKQVLQLIVNCTGTKLKATALNELKILDYRAHLQCQVKLYLELSSNYSI